MAHSHVHARTQKIDKLLTAGAPQLGIFWIDSGTRKLVSCYGEPLESGIDPFGGESEIVDCTVTHPQLWNVSMASQYPDLKWDQVPRGRVYYRKNENTFYVYGPAAYLSDSNIQSQILSEFNLPENTIFEPNQDYETYIK